MTGVRLPVGQGLLLFSTALLCPDWLWVHLASYRMGSRGSSLGVKQLGCEADHSYPSSAKVKDAWSYTSTPTYNFMASYLAKHRDNYPYLYI
jgi:hypothetical protein